MSDQHAPPTADDLPKERYDAALAGLIERTWQQVWQDQGTFNTPNPVGPLSEGFERVAGRPKLFVMDMFPYPSGVGLHVGHPLGYIATDVFARFKRMTGHNVLHTMGYDAFGLPAEQFAMQTGTHPRVTTEANVANMERQLRSLGLGHDPRRAIRTTDAAFYRWTQWIFLQVFNSWFDPDSGIARPIEELQASFAAGGRATPDGRSWGSLSVREQRQLIDDHRLAYVAETPVNWCPGLGTVVANEEVTADGRSDRGNFPVFKRNMRQWNMRITAYAQRLIDDLDLVDWPEPVKLMQRNWIGRSEGALVRFSSAAGPIEVFTTRPDTLFGATYMVLRDTSGHRRSMSPLRSCLRRSRRRSACRRLKYRHATRQIPGSLSPHRCHLNAATKAHRPSQADSEKHAETGLAPLLSRTAPTLRAISGSNWSASFLSSI